ncbi:hypothetical protein FRC06_005498 [Ceratobasidium sp. 370]|nr:hypothetical protein FRC06_005498 [Ceratobasidium sp. 370]
MALSVDAELVENIIKQRSQVENACYLAMASYMMLVYDILIRMDDEVTYIRSGRWTFGRAVYHLNRYTPLVILPLNAAMFFASSITPSTFV